MANIYLSKPVKRANLLRKIQRYLSKASLAANADRRICSELNWEQFQDEVIEEFRPRYVAELPARVAKLLAQLGHQDLNELQAVIHGLSGSSGFFGYMKISDAAHHMERLILQGAPIDEIIKMTNRLIEQIRAVKGYSRSSEERESSHLILPVHS